MKLSFRAVKILFSILAIFMLFSACSGEDGAPNVSSQPTGGPKSSAKVLLSFDLTTPAATGVIDEVGKTVTINLPYGTSVTALTPLLTISPDATASPNSGVAQDFSAPVVYTVTAEDGSQANYTVTVNVASATSKEITAFSFQSLSPAVVATINQTSKTITAALPYGVSRNGLVATFSTTGSSVVVATTAQVSGTTPNDFSSSVVYKVTAADSSFANYTVTVTNAPASKACDITSFAIGSYTGIINQGARTITITVPYGTDRSSMTPTIALSEFATVSPNSGVAANFSSPVTFTVTAQDGTTQKAYTVTVTEAAASTACDISGFTINGIAGTINQTARTVTLTVPHGTSLASLSPVISVSPYATVNPASGAAQNFSSGAVNYTVTAQDGSTTKVYAVTVTEAAAPTGPGVFIMAFCPDYNSSTADGSGTWVDIKIKSITTLSSYGEWKLRTAYKEYAINDLLSASAISGWSYSDGSVIRVHGPNYTGSTSSATLHYKTSASYGPNFKSGMIWIEDGSGNVVDMVTYKTANSGGEWVSGTQATILGNAVTASLWPGATSTSAFDFGSTSSVFARVKNTVSDGNSAADWETTDGSESDAPTVTIISPANNATVSSYSIAISGSAADPGAGASGVKEVWVKLDSGSEVKATGTTSWSYSFAGVTEGSHTITVYSKDNAGNSSTPSVLNVTVSYPPDNDNPTVSITAPTAASSVAGPTITVNGTANDPGATPSGVKEIWVKLDSGSEVKASGTTSWTHSFGSVSEGSHTITVYAKDYRDNSSTLSTVTFTVTAPTGLTEDLSLSSAIRSYYTSAYGKTGAALKTALNTIIKSGHTRKSYDDIWDVMDDADAWNGKVILMYTGAQYNPGVRYPTWNREHTWPKSHGFPSSGMYGYTDAHHLRPTDPGVNSTRGSKDFDNGGSTVSAAPGCKTDSDSFEPRDEVKGDCARMIFYMATRYEGNGGDGGMPDLKIVNYTGTSGAMLGKLSTLLQWHIDDPVDDRERHRNQSIYDNWQHNRNPFIDYPAAVQLIWGTPSSPVTY